MTKTNCTSSSTHHNVHLYHSEKVNFLFWSTVTPACSTLTHACLKFTLDVLDTITVLLQCLQTMDHAAKAKGLLQGANKTFRYDAFRHGIRHSPLLYPIQTSWSAGPLKRGWGGTLCMWAPDQISVLVCSSMVTLHFAKPAITTTSTVTMIMPGHWNAKKHIFYLESIASMIQQKWDKWWQESTTTCIFKNLSYVHEILTCYKCYCRDSIKPLAASIMTKHFYTCDGLCCRSTSCKIKMLTKLINILKTCGT